MPVTNTPINRNGAITDFAAFAPKPMSLDEAMRRSIAKARAERDNGAPLPVERTSTTILDLDDHTLIRYILNSDELTTDCIAAGMRTQEVPCHTPDYYPFTAIFGVMDKRTGRASAIIEAMGDGRRANGEIKELDINHVFKAEDADLPGSTLAAMLNHLDLPASRRNGIDHQMSRFFDLRQDPDTGVWFEEEPMYVVSVRFERICFSTAPTVTEIVDVLVPIAPDEDIADPDENKAYWAKDYYRNEAFAYFHELTSGAGVRPGFSSWGPKGDPVLVKILDPDFRKTMEEAAAKRAQEIALEETEGDDNDDDTAMTP